MVLSGLQEGEVGPWCSEDRESFSSSEWKGPSDWPHTVWTHLANLPFTVASLIFAALFEIYSLYMQMYT